MDKIKALLLPLALVFAAIAIFELGARYGASNTRAIALTEQLNNYIHLYRQVKDRSTPSSLANLEAAIDHHAMTAALERGAWYLRLKEEPKASLEIALAEALRLRGDAVLMRFDAMEASTEAGAPKISSARLAEIHSALEAAQIDLIAHAETAE